MALDDMVAKRPFGEVATQWMEVFLPRDEFPNAQIRARAAGIHTVEVEQGQTQPILLVRLPTHPGHVDTYIPNRFDQIIRGTADAIEPPAAFKHLEFRDSQSDQARKAKTRPNTGAWLVELAVEALFDHLTKHERELLRLYLIPISIIQEQQGLRHTGPEIKKFILDNWIDGDVGVLRAFRLAVGSRPPARMTWRPASTIRIERLEALERRINLLHGARWHDGAH